MWHEGSSNMRTEARKRRGEMYFKIHETYRLKL